MLDVFKVSIKGIMGIIFKSIILGIMYLYTHYFTCSK